MPALLCSQCAAPLSREAARGLVPCASCGVINAPAPGLEIPRTFAQGPLAGTRVCPACRHANAAHYKFCLGCGLELPAPS